MSNIWISTISIYYMKIQKNTRMEEYEISHTHSLYREGVLNAIFLKLCIYYIKITLHTLSYIWHTHTEICIHTNVFVKVKVRRWWFYVYTVVLNIKRSHNESLIKEVCVRWCVNLKKLRIIVAFQPLGD